MIVQQKENKEILFVFHKNTIFYCSFYFYFSVLNYKRNVLVLCVNVLTSEEHKNGA